MQGEREESLGRGLGPAASAEDEETRRRVVDGLAAAIVEKGYVQTTIADIVRHARVSKRTFYEHFGDKEECFLAGYKAVSGETLQLITAASVADGSWQERVAAASHAYLAALEAFPALTRTYLVELYAAGPRALAERRRVHKRFADLLRTLANAARSANPAMRPLTPAMATAVVGGIHELVLAELESEEARAPENVRLTHLAATATELVLAVVAPVADPVVATATRTRSRR